MSLLLDALRRAEEARRAKEADNNAKPAARAVSAREAELPPPPPSATARTLSLEEPADAVAARPVDIEAGERLPPPAVNSRFALEAVPVVIPDLSPPPFASESPPIRSAPVATTPKEIPPRDVARNVFTSKQASAQTMGSAGKRKWILPAVAGILVLLGAGGWYVLNEIGRFSKPMVTRTLAAPAALPVAAPDTGQLGSQPASVVTVAEMPLPPMLPPAASDAPMPKNTAQVATARVSTGREAIANNLRDAPVVLEAAPALKLTPSSSAPRLNPDLALAYQSLASGDYAAAQKLYSKLVLSEPLNVDAQLGLATAAARTGDYPSARQHYRQVLALDPRNGLAIVGLVALNEGTQPAALEIELKTLIGRNPDAAPLHFALGNLYASGQRWTEAQQAYFEAYRLEAANPDYLFNLAVSLDQLRQNRLALDYYRKAEAVAAARGGGQFDRNTINRRIRELSGEAGRNN